MLSEAGEKCAAAVHRGFGGPIDLFTHTAAEVVGWLRAR